MAALFGGEPRPYLDEGTQKSKDIWVLSWNDEFDSKSTIDENWVAENFASSHLLCSRWRENISVEDGYAVITNKKEHRGGKDWTAGSMSTKKSFKYGFFEARMKISAATGVNNSFWMRQNQKTDSLHAFEIDIAEAHYPGWFQTNIHDWGTLTNSKHTQSGVHYQGDTPTLSDGFHIYAVEWNRENFIFYFDGKVIRTLPNDFCFSPAHIVLGTAILQWAGNVTDAIDKTSMTVDYVRVWTRK